MTLTLCPELERAITAAAEHDGVAPELLAVQTLRERFLGRAAQGEPRDDWERNLRRAATDCGVSLSNEALSSEGLYD